MALVKYGAGIVQMSGSIAGDVHARNRFGNYIRPRTKPVNPHSERQERARAILSYLAEYWHTDLDHDQRGLWGDYAAAVAMTNRLGETIHLTGYNHFIRTNAAALKAGGGVFVAAPKVLSLPEKDTVLQCVEESIADQTFSFICDTAGWAADTEYKYWIAIHQGRPQLASRNQYSTPWRYMGIIDVNTGSEGGATITKAFPFALGQKVWFQARLMSITGRLSQAWQLNPRTIVKDPDG